MPIGLAIEMSGRVGSIALALDGRAIASEEFAHGLQNAAQVIPIIDRLCRAYQFAPNDLRELYVSIGPGSFTGLRIAVTLAKTLSFATGAMIVAIPSTRVLAYNAPPESRHVVIVLDAKRGMIFTARYERSGNEWIEQEPPQLSDVATALAEAPRPVHLIGEGIPHHAEAIRALAGPVIITSEAHWRADAKLLATLGAKESQNNQFADPQLLAPLYLRLPEAEEKRLKDEATRAEKIDPRAADFSRGS